MLSGEEIRGLGVVDLATSPVKRTESTASAVARPSTDATWPRTRSMTSASRSRSGVSSRRRASEPLAAARRGGTCTSPRSIGGSSPALACARRAAAPGP